MAISRPENSALSTVQVSEKALNCTICMDDDIAEEQKPKMVITACGHSFHEECMQTCFNKMPENKKNCPVCRQETVPFTRPSGIDEQAGDEENPYFESRFVKLIRRNSISATDLLIEALKLDEQALEAAGTSGVTAEPKEDWSWVPQTIEEAVEVSVIANRIQQEEDGAWGGAPLAEIKTASEIAQERQVALNKHYHDPISNVKTSLLGIAATCNNKEAALRLINAGAKIDEPDSRGNTPLMQAIQHKNTDLAMLLIGLGADVNAKNHAGVTPSHFAVATGNLAMLENLLEQGADIKAHNTKGLGLLYVAAKHGHKEMLLTLCTKGLDYQLNSNLAPDGITPLYTAVYNGHLEVTEQLLLLGADPEMTSKSHKVTPLHVAANKGNVEMCNLLLNYKANINARMTNGSTPLIEAVAYWHIDAARLLIERGADKKLKKRFPISQTIFPQSAADIARGYGDTVLYELVS